MLVHRLPYLLIAALIAGLFIAGAVGLSASAQSPVPSSSAPLESDLDNNILTPLPPGPPSIILFNQYDYPASNSYTSQNFEPSMDAYDSFLADDFAVPADQTWSLTQVDVLGEYFGNTGPADSFNVFIYLGGAPYPGTLIASRTNLAYTELTHNFSISVAPLITLSPGRYWISVQANQNYTPNGQWGWAARSVLRFNPAAWQNPGGGFAVCPTWGARGTCLASESVPDQIYNLIGTVTYQRCGIPSHWTLRKEMPRSVYSVMAANDTKNAYVFGGFDIDASQTLTQTLRYNPVSTAWTELKPMTKDTAMGSAVYSTVNNKIYVFGGEDIATGEVYTSTQVYDIASNTWMNAAPLPDKRAFMASGYYNGKIYLVGGYSTGSITPAFSQTWEYDVLSNTWQTKASMPAALGGAASVVQNGHLFVMGGRDASNNLLNMTYDYNITADTWIVRDYMPYAVNVAGSAAVDGKIWVIGGGTPFLGDDSAMLSSINQPEALNSTLIYDPATDTWSTGPALNVARSFLAATYVRGRLLAFGGYGGSGSSNIVEEMGTCWSYLSPVKGKP